MDGTILYHTILSCQKSLPHTNLVFQFFLNAQILKITGTCKEENVNYQEIIFEY